MIIEVASAKVIAVVWLPVDFAALELKGWTQDISGNVEAVFEVVEVGIPAGGEAVALVVLDGALEGVIDADLGTADAVYAVLAVGGEIGRRENINCAAIHEQQAVAAIAF